MARRTNVQPWILVTCIGLAILTSVLLFIFAYAHIAPKLFPHRRPTADADDDRLLHVTVVVCPGDRMPMRPYTSDPWSAPHYWPNAWGELSQVGRDQHAELGGWLRRRYAAQRFNATQVGSGVRSIGCSTRTRFGVGATLAAMFAELNRTTVAVQCDDDPGTSAATTGGGGDCRALREWHRWAQRHWERPLLAAHRNLTEHLQRHSADRMQSLQQIGRLYDTLHVERLYGRQLPLWTQSVFPGSGEFAELAAQRFAMQAASVDMVRLRFGGLLREIVDRWRSVAVRGAEPTVWMYGVERETLAGVMQALGVFETHVPPYCATLLAEVRLVGGEPNVRLLYRNGTTKTTTTTMRPLLMPGCGTLCPVGQMQSVYEEVLPERSVNDDCERLLPPAETNGATTLGVINACRAGLVMVVMVVICY